MKKVMILMSAYTGHGHKSITDSLIEQFSAYPDVESEVVEGFALIGRAAISSAKMYGPVTQRTGSVEIYLSYVSADQQRNCRPAGHHDP